jgi:hypothetical protein
VGRERATVRRQQSESGSISAGQLGHCTNATGSPVECFVAELVHELGLGDTSSGRRARRALHRLCLWAAGEGLALDREQILDPDTVERFVETGLAGNRSRATYRSELRRVGPVLTTRAPWEPRPPSVARRQVALPYAAEEVALLRADARLQPTPARRRAARAFLALGLGAGLDGRWAPRVGANDVFGSPAGVVVHVGEPAARGVAVLAEWEDELDALASSAGDQFLVGGRSTSANRTGNLVAQLLVPTGHPKLAPARLRSTWLVTHLRAGTRLPELCRAAGLQGATVLSDLLEHVDPLDTETARTMLRGPTS